MGVENEYSPVDGILDPNTAIDESRELIDTWSPYLADLIGHSTRVLRRCETSLKGIGGTPSSLIYIYYHVIQMADAIRVLCASACFTAAYPSLRSLWEGAVSIEYMLKADFEDRSTAWLACGHLNGKEYWELQDLTSSRGKEIEELRKSDRFFFNCKLGESDQSLVKKQIDIYERVLQKPKFASVISKISKDQLRQKKWYSVNQGETSLKGLAKALRRPMEYEFLYSKYSSVSHSKDSTRMLDTDGSTLHFARMRSGRNGNEVYGLTCSYLIETTLLVSSKLRPAEDIARQMKRLMRKHPQATSLK